MASSQTKKDSPKDNLPFWDRAPSPSPPPTQRKTSENLSKRPLPNVTKPKSAPNLAQKKSPSPQSTRREPIQSKVASLSKSKSVGSKVSKAEPQTSAHPEPPPLVETKKRSTLNLPYTAKKLKVIKEEAIEWPDGTKPATSLKDALAEFPTSPPNVKPITMVTKPNLKRRSSPRKVANKTPEVSKQSQVKDIKIKEGKDLTVNKTEANPGITRASRRDDKNLKVPVWMRDNVSKPPTKNVNDDQPDTTPFWERQTSKSPTRKRLSSSEKGKSISPSKKRNIKKVPIQVEATSQNTSSKQQNEASDEINKAKGTSSTLSKSPSKIPTSKQIKDPTTNKIKREHQKTSQVKQSIPESKPNPTKATIGPKRNSVTTGSNNSKKTSAPATYNQHISDEDECVSPEKINKVSLLSGNPLDVKEKMNSVQSKIKTFRDDPWASKFKAKDKKEQNVKVIRLLSDGVKDKTKQLSLLKSRYGKMTIRKPNRDNRQTNSDSEVDTKEQPRSKNKIKLTGHKQAGEIKKSYSDSEINQAAGIDSDITVTTPPPVTTIHTKKHARKDKTTDKKMSPYISPSKVCKETQVTPTKVTRNIGKILDIFSRQRANITKDQQLDPDQHDTSSSTDCTPCLSYVVEVNSTSGSLVSSDSQSDSQLLCASVNDIYHNEDEDEEFSRRNKRSPELKASVYLGDEHLYQAAFTSGRNDDYIEDLRKVFNNKLDVTQRNKIKSRDRNRVLQTSKPKEELRQLSKSSPKMFHNGKWIDDRSIEWNESESNVLIFASSRKNDTGEDVDIRKESFKNRSHPQYDVLGKENSRNTKQHRDELQSSSKYLDNKVELKQIQLHKQIDFENTLQQNSIETESKHSDDYEEEPNLEDPFIRPPEKAWSEEGYSSCSSSESEIDEETALQIKRDFKETLATLYENNYQLAVDILSLKEEFLQIKKEFEKRPLKSKKPGELRPLGNLADYLMIVGVMAFQFVLQYVYLKP